MSSPVPDKLAQAKICGDSSLQHDLGEWLNLELVDDVGTDGNENAELDSLLVTDCLGMKQSHNEVNWSDPTYKNAVFTKNLCTHKCANTRRKECFTGCTTDDDWLEPADDWNQWTEPGYVERMINLSSSLQSHTISNLNEATEMITTEKYNSFCRSKTCKCLGKSNGASKISKRVKKCNRKRLISDHRKIYVRKFAAAAVQKSQSNVLMDNCCTRHTDEAAFGCLEKSDKCLKSFQLLVSISFDRLVTVRHLKKQQSSPRV